MLDVFVVNPNVQLVGRWAGKQAKQTNFPGWAMYLAVHYVTKFDNMFETKGKKREW